MRCTDDHYQRWIADHMRLADYCCEEQQYGCRSYHVLAPLLHQLGVFTSYQRYAPILGPLVGHFVKNGTCPSILVAGVASEETARSLFEALGPSNRVANIHFIDRCRTPLRRIESMLNADESGLVTTDTLDVLQAGAFKRTFDLIMGDSFLRQFSRENKRRILFQLVQAMNCQDSVIVFREYFGDTAALLDDLWHRMHLLPSVQHWMAIVDDKVAVEFNSMMHELRVYMRQAGGSYPSLEAFIDDLSAVGLGIDQICAIEGEGSSIITCRRQLKVEDTYT